MLPNTSKSISNVVTIERKLSFRNWWMVYKFTMFTFLSIIMNRKALLSSTWKNFIFSYWMNVNTRSIKKFDNLIWSICQFYFFKLWFKNNNIILFCSCILIEIEYTCSAFKISNSNMMKIRIDTNCRYFPIRIKRRIK